MPYDAERLKIALVEMVNDGKTSWAELERIFAEGSKSANFKWSLGRQTIERFTNPDYKGQVGKAEEFEFLHSLLRDRVRLRPYLPEPGDVAEAAAALLPSALGGFFNQGYAMPALQKALAGEYVMWRRDLEPSRVLKDGIRISRLIMKPVENGLHVVELQEASTIADLASYYQRDEGYIFSHQQYIYWLTKEAETCVKLGVITNTVPMVPDGPERIKPNGATGMHMELLSGYMAAFSRTARYPRARIFCRPRTLLKDIRYGVIPLSEVSDPRAKEYISKDFEGHAPDK